MDPDAARAFKQASTCSTIGFVRCPAVRPDAPGRRALGERRIRPGIPSAARRAIRFRPVLCEVSLRLFPDAFRPIPSDRRWVRPELPLGITPSGEPDALTGDELGPQREWSSHGFLEDTARVPLLLLLESEPQVSGQSVRHVKTQ
jgi:hypothetical protein